jgi:hypothetical protein
MSRPVVVLGVALTVCACVATPELEYTNDVEAAAADAAEVAPDAAEVASDATVTPSTTDAAPRSEDAARDTTVEATGPTCPLVLLAGAGCCVAHTPSDSRTCVRDACTHCDDCLHAKCRTTQFCCPRVDGEGKYKGSTCADSPTC